MVHFFIIVSSLIKLTILLSFILFSVEGRSSAVENENYYLEKLDYDLDHDCLCIEFSFLRISQKY